MFLGWSFFKKQYIFLFEMKLEVICPFSCCYMLYYKWLLSFSNQHTSVAEKLWLPGRKKKKSWTSKQSRLSPIACLPFHWRSNSSKAAGIPQDFFHFICHYIPVLSLGDTSAYFEQATLPSWCTFLADETNYSYSKFGHIPEESVKFDVNTVFGV